MAKHAWQIRARDAGLSQKTLAGLLGHAEITVSRQLRGQWDAGVVPLHVRSAILAWEIMSLDQRETWMASVAALRAERGESADG